LRKRIAIGLLAAAAVVGIVVAQRHELLRFGIQVLPRIAGYAVTADAVSIGGGSAVLQGVAVDRGSSPVLRARRIALRYSLRDLLPGSRHRFGLLGIEVSDATVTLTRYRDGSFNVSFPQGGPAPAAAPRVNPVPIAFSVRVRGLRLDLREPAAYDESARSVRIGDIDVDGKIDTAAVTEYRASGAFVTRRRSDPFTIAGRVDAVRGFADHRARARVFPLRALANYFADTAAVRILHGAARNFDAEIYALGVVPNVAPEYHVSLSLDMEGGRIALQSLAAPIESVRARLHLIDNTFYVRNATATLTGIPLRIEGGVYDLSGGLTGRQQLRVGVSGAGDLKSLRRAFQFMRDQPVAGATQLGVLVAGPIDDPVIVARASAARARYRALPFDALSAGVVYHAGVVALAPLRASYAGLDVVVRGTLVTGTPLHSTFALHVTAPASRLPYLDEMLGNEPVEVDAAATGTDLVFHVAGSAASTRGVGRLAALVSMNPNGTARIEPFWLHTERGDLDGGYILDRPHQTSAFWLAADNLRMHPPPHPVFPGLELPQMPPIASRRVGASIAGGGAGTKILLAGKVTGDDATISGVTFDRLEAGFGGTLAHAAINSLRAAGPWGRFNGRGSFSPQQLVAVGDYAGSFEGLQPFLGTAISGHGGIAGSVAVAVAGQRIVVQGSDLRMHEATLRGVPIERASLTLAVEKDRLQIYSANARAAGGSVVAAGSFSLAPPSRAAGGPAVALVADRLHAAQLRGIGLPLTTGNLYATGNLAAGSPTPTFDGGVVVESGRIANFALSGAGEVHLAGDAVTLHRMLGAVGGTYARVDGTIGSLSSGSPVYALDADVPAGGVAKTLHAFGFPNYMTDGSFNARLRVGGRSLAPTIAGHVEVPAGEVNGLPFVDAGAQIAAGKSGVSMHQGSVLVGTTAAHFTAVAQRSENEIDVSAPRADLSDFNNFFDTGDTLDGDGSLKIAADAKGSRVTSSGNIDVRGLRYRNLPIGDTRAVWSSANNTIDGAVAVGGAEGMLRAKGSIGLTPSRDWQTMAANSRFNLGASIENLDLALWMPALGMQSVPVTGRASGDATVRGRYPNLDLRANARLAGGTLGPLTLDRAELSLHTAGRRFVIDKAAMTTPELSATASGTLGLSPESALDVRVHAATDRLAQLTYAVSRFRVPLSGSFESTLQIGGTYAAPNFVAGFDATGVRAYGVPIASLFGELRLQRNALVLSNAGLTFARGEATLAGSVPLRLNPLRVGDPDQPVSFDVGIVGLDPGIFDDTLRNNTKLGGSIDGHLGLSGTIRRPVIVGRFSLANGSYVSDLERAPITQMAAALAFNRTTATIDRLSARVGNGSVQGSGAIDFPNGFGASGAFFAFKGSARGASLDLPAYGSGTLDATMALEKRAGSQALLSGDVTLSNATLAFATFVKAAQGAGGATLPPVPLAFDLRATAGKNVRVRGSGYGAGLDIGATGSVTLAGTLAAPKLNGSFDSTGGALTYFDRAFRVREGTVKFESSDGVLPTLHAVATTTVVNPDPDRVRNPYGSAEITITVDGPIQGLRIGFTSNPTGYTQDQILALIAPLGGFFSGIGYSRESMLARQNPSGITPLGTLSPIPDVSVAQNSSITVGQEAFNILNAQFTAGLLAPFENSLGQGLGLSSVNLTLGYYGNVGVSATRLLGKSVSAVYAVTFGVPQVQSFGLITKPNATTSALLNFYYQSGPTKLLQSPASPVGYNVGYLLGQPLISNSGFSLTVQHYFP
jgi:TamB, inner membrane protein subunit of TAM complex